MSCIDCTSGLSDLVHAPTRHMEWVATQPLPVIIQLIIYSVLRVAWWFCSSHQIWSHSLGALRLRWTTSLCVDCFFGHVRPSTCVHRICGMLGHTFMSCGSSPSNILNLEDGLVVLQFSPNLVPYLGYSEA